MEEKDLRFNMGDSVKVVRIYTASGELEPKHHLIGETGTIDLVRETGLIHYRVLSSEGTCFFARDSELEFVDEIKTSPLGKFEEMATELGALVDSKQAAYGNAVDTTQKVLEVFMERYKVHDGYHMPEELLPHLLLMVRIIDKQCRIFSNPTGDLMGESPYKDLAGYGLLGSDMVNKKK